MLREGCGRRGEGDDALVGVLVGEELYEGSAKSPEGIKVVREDLGSVYISKDSNPEPELYPILFAIQGGPTELYSGN